MIGSIQVGSAPIPFWKSRFVKIFDWQPHTVRGAIAGALKKKLGLDVTSEKIEGRGLVCLSSERDNHRLRTVSVREWHSGGVGRLDVSGALTLWREIAEDIQRHVRIMPSNQQIRTNHESRLIT